MTTKPRETQIEDLIQRIQDKAHDLRLDAASWREASDSTGGHAASVLIRDALENERQAAEFEGWADELSAILREEAWQPIETAPKDGTFLILATTDKRVGEARWVENAWYWAGNDPTDSYGWPVWEYEAAGWMPLPAAPKGGED